MADTEMSTAQRGKEDSRPKCNVCEQVVPRYRCPRCMVRTCSLPCVKRHKAENNCNGVRDKTAYVKTKEFTDINLLNDYRFLEDVGRKTDSATRDPVNSTRKDLPWHLKTLIAQVKKRKTTLQLLPRVFTKRQKNRTKYYHVTDKILWTVEWVFPQADAKHFDKHVDTDKVGDCLRKIFNPVETDPVVCHKLRGYLKYGLDNLMLLLKKENCPANDQRFYKLNPAKRIQRSLRNKVIVEYPTIHVIFKEKADAYKLVSDEEAEESSSESESEEEDAQVKPADNNNGDVQMKDGGDHLKDATSDKDVSNGNDSLPNGDSNNQHDIVSEHNQEDVPSSNTKDVAMEESDNKNVASNEGVGCEKDRDNGSSVNGIIKNNEVLMAATDSACDKAKSSECDNDVKRQELESSGVDTGSTGVDTTTT